MVLVCLGQSVGLRPSTCVAADFVEGFDGPKPTWTIFANPRSCRTVDHRRYTQIRRFGSGAERIVVSADRITPLSLMHRVSPARTLEDLTASLWCRSNRSGGKLMLRVIFPNAKNPETGTVVDRWIEGDAYTADNKWQLLKCQTTEKELRRKMQLLRATLGSGINLNDAYVDRVQFAAELGTGTTEFYFDELKLGPVVNPGRTANITENDPVEQETLPRITLQHDRMLWDGRPFFPTLLPYHKEPIPELSDLGLRLVWIPEFDDGDLIQSITSAGLGVVATPPLALSPEGEVLDAEVAGLAPLDEPTDPILMWMLGTAVPAEERSRLASWQKQLMLADRRVNRPLMADVLTEERAFSRLVPVLGVSRSVHQTSLDYSGYHQWLADRRLIARPGSFLWTWIETESPSNRVWDRSQVQPVLEPEQLRLAVYSALSTGVRGLGFWSKNGLFENKLGADEARLMLKQLHLEIELLEPWLATATPAGQAKIEFARHPPTLSMLSSPSGRRATRLDPANQPIRSAGYQSELGSDSNRLSLLSGHAQDRDANNSKSGTVPTPHIEGTLLQSEFGTLLLGIWSDPYSQFVPGQLAAHDVNIVVPGIKETAKAWLITTTDIKPLVTDRNATPGGTLIRLPQCELTMAIIISSDLSLGERLRQQMKTMQATSAQCLVQLARAKLKRVTNVVDELQALGRLQPDADRMLGKARQLANNASNCLQRSDYPLAREMADSALQMLRILQRAQWDDAVSGQTHPVSNIDTICFQTLPEYWRQLATQQTGTVQSSPNLLPTGNFERPNQLQVNPVERWEHQQADLPGVVATAELSEAESRSGKSLRVAATMVAGTAVPLAVQEVPVTIISPPILLPPNQWVKIEGFVKVSRPFQGTRDGFQIHDSLGGEPLALRFYEPGGWQRFELHRPVVSREPLRLTFQLCGLGEVWLDDISVQAYSRDGNER